MLPFMREPKQTNPILHQADGAGSRQSAGGQDNARKQNAGRHKEATGSQHPQPSGAEDNDETAEYHVRDKRARPRICLSSCSALEYCACGL